MDPDDYKTQYSDPRKAKMAGWFYANYKDPADGVPHDSSEGGYQYIFGGPYDPQDELYAKFKDVYPSNVIEEVASDIMSSGGPDWVKTNQY